MKTVWNIISVLAVANLLAVAGFLGWLRMTDRLSADRARAVRELLAPTIAADTATAEQKKAADVKALKEKEAAEKAARPPLTAAEKLAARVEATELDRQRLERLRREVEDLQNSVSRDRADVDAKRSQLTADQKAFDEQVKQVAALASTEQFKKTLDILQALKPAAAKAMLLEVIGPQAAAAGPTSAEPAPTAGVGANSTASIDQQPGARSAPEGMRIAIEYLNAMEDRARAKVMTEFAKDSPALAAQLLESLRKRGQFARAEAGTNP
ncbi:MAG: hypothetical protein U0637_13495 [Phycisphaerales bacterium]